MKAPETKIALELYTIRDFMKNESDFAKAMEKTRKAGYEAVELAGVSKDIPVKTVKKILDDNGLYCMATQDGLKELTDGLSKKPIGRVWKPFHEGDALPPTPNPRGARKERPNRRRGCRA